MGASKVPKEIKPTGRETVYSAALGDLICERLMDGESLKSICSEETMPNRATVFRWIVANETFRDMYARAREEQADTMADEIVSIADEGETKVVMGGDGTSMVVFDSTAVARNRLRVDARKWVAAKLKPRKYGDKVQTEISGPNGGPVETVSKIILEAG